MKLTKLMTLALMAALTAGMSACGDDNDKNEPQPNPDISGDSKGELPAPADVFTGGMPRSVDGMEITRNAQGLVTSIIDRTDGETYNFDYVPATRAVRYDMTMTLANTLRPSDSDVFYFQLNDHGYITYALKVESDGDTESWQMTYDSAGHLTRVISSDNRSSIDITYRGGDIVSVTNGREVTEISYDMPLQANLGCIMLYDELFDIDLDDLEATYYAGLLGRATDNLPTAKKQGRDKETFVWTINTSGLPTRVECHEVYGTGSVIDDVVTFSW